MSAAPGRPKQARTEAEGEGTPVSAAPGRPKQARTEAEGEGTPMSAAASARKHPASMPAPIAWYRALAHSGLMSACLATSTIRTRSLAT